MTVRNVDRGICFIEQLQGVKFLVAEYQRGYKWTEDEVGKLIDDINSFDENSEEFYCLQPLVVSSCEDGSWELIDGQQRMMTIYLILSYLNEKLFNIDYKTRKGCTEFLEKITSSQIDGYNNWDDFIKAQAVGIEFDNVDNYHFFIVWRKIVECFQLIRAQNKEQHWKTKLLKNTGLIWYEIKGKDHQKIFLNLNSGKIQLNNSELIKALFLKPNDRQTEMAQEWDRIEYALQKDSFWFFINKDAKTEERSTRIDYIFDLVVSHKNGIQNKLIKEQFHTFLYYATIDNFDTNRHWSEIKSCFQTLQEWYDEDDEDRELYHDIGFLITQNIASVSDLWVACQNKCKHVFRQEITDKIKNEFRNVVLEDLYYAKDERSNHKIHKILVLFNIKSLKKGARFQFDLYKKEDWSLEHIHARNSKSLDSDTEWEVWVHEVCPHLGTGVDEEVHKLRYSLQESTRPNFPWQNKSEERAKFKDKVFELLSSDLTDENINWIGNLALLSRDLNSSLNNGLFPSKRQKIIEWDKNGKFIPIATKNVFLKYYQGDISQMNKWMRIDQEAYLKEIQDLLADYILRR